MAIPVFFFLGYFCKRSVKGRKEKIRVIADPHPSPRPVCDDALDAVRNHRQDPATLGDGRNANKTRAALVSLFPLHVAQQLANSVFVCGIRPSVARGMDSWCSPEGGHNQAGIL